MEPIGMPAWLAVLREQRTAVAEGVARLRGEYDAERTFSHDAFDLDYDADLRACADAGDPVVAALDRAIATVEAVVARPRGGRA